MYIWLLLLLFSCMMTISQDIFNIFITCVVYEVRRKGIIYSKTYFFSLSTPCLGVKSQSNKSRFFFFFAKVSNRKIQAYCVFVMCNILFAILKWIWCYEWGHKDLLIQLHLVSLNIND